MFAFYIKTEFDGKYKIKTALGMTKSCYSKFIIKILLSFSEFHKSHLMNKLEQTYLKTILCIALLCSRTLLTQEPCFLKKGIHVTECIYLQNIFL